MKSKSYDCSKCPGYCCSYPLIEVSRADVARLAKHHGLDYETAEERFTFYDKGEKIRSLRKHKDEHFGTVCRFLDPKLRRCTVYEARPEACRDYPYSKSCGYYQFLKFERTLQDDKKFVATTNS
jgi:Fe-S-cluster containining protein